MFPNILYWGDYVPVERQPLAKYREYAESFSQQSGA